MKGYSKVITVILLVQIVTGLTTSCDNTNSTKNQRMVHDKKLDTDKTEYKSKHLYIKDQSKYERAFIDGLISLSTGQEGYITLIDDVLTVNKEQYSLSSEIEPGKKYFFSKTERNRQTNLILIRHNFSSIEFNLKISGDEKVTLKKAGVATLDSSFFLGSESEENEETGESYFVTTYNHEDKDGYINIKVGEDENGFLRVRVRFKEIENLSTLKLNKAINI